MPMSGGKGYGGTKRGGGSKKLLSNAKRIQPGKVHFGRHSGTGGFQNR